MLSVCSSSSKKLCNNGSACNICFLKSFASRDRAKNWSPKNKKTPRDVFYGTQAKYLFLCECEHEFSISLANISGGKWCPFCARPPRQLCSDLNCQNCFCKSFASSTKSKYWSSNNNCDPRDVFISSGKEYKFLCVCGHEFSSRLNLIQKGRWCPFCSVPPKRLCNSKNCQKCFDKSFASSDKACYWSINNKYKPRDIFLYSHKKILFDCNLCGNEFETNLYHISEGKWCFKCKNKTENKLCTYFKMKYPSYSITCQPTFDWCKNFLTNKKFPYDFLLTDPSFAFCVIIELDGPQHFRQISNWRSPKIQHQRDVYKDLFASYYGYSVIRILQEDVFYDKNDWQIKLNCAINIATQDSVILHIYDEKISQIAYEIDTNFIN